MSLSRMLLFSGFLVLCLNSAKAQDEDPGGCEGNSKSPYSKLRKDVFCNYDVETRPVKDRKTPVKLNATFHVRYLSMSEAENILKVHVLAEITWRDEFIKWKPEDYGGVQVIVVDRASVWTPDLILYNDRFYYGSRSDLFISSVHVYYTGLMYALPQGELSAHCNLDLYRWPFDRHTCKAYVGSTNYNGNQLDIELRKNRTVNMDLYLNSSVWELESVSASKLSFNIGATNATKTKYVRFVKTFNVRRFSSGLFSTIGLPIIACISLTLSTFWMDLQNPARSICTLVSLAGHISFLQYLGNLLPANSTKNILIIIILRDSLLVTLLTFVASIVNRRIQALQTAPPHSLISLINKMSNSGPVKFLMLPDDQEIATSSDDEVTLVKTATKLKHEWVLISTLIDRSLFFIFSSVYIILYLVYSLS
ncbi:nicotinic acetylcholine receptor [Nesidiocoris tenuis]|uniref:Nicotinic acetylcholine receptor n=1 Tax=Nesidiocoris tenuis TaxID=355587 RepID=A0ABN7B373_9HEMI|nr:nicotinic acetylcholine receptor [Nesidiocoris tenuis]